MHRTQTTSSSALQTNKINHQNITTTSSNSNNSSSSCNHKMSITIVSLLALLISISAFSTRTLVESKPLNQNQVKFRRLPPKEFSAALGSSITIECEAGASPPPTIHWLRDGKRIIQNEIDENQLEDLQQNSQVDELNRIALSSTRSRLYIDCANDDDEATYTCVAENAFSRVSSHTKLNLIRSSSQSAASSTSTGDLAAIDSNGAKDQQQQLAANQNEAQKSLTAVPQCLSQQRRGVRQSDSSASVRIHMWTHNIIEIMKNDVILYCRSNIKKPTIASNGVVATTSAAISADSPLKSADELASAVEQLQLEGASSKGPQISWALPDDKLVTADMRDKYEILETGDLLIKDLRWADMGSYVCTVSDDQSSDSISTFVYPAASKANSSNKRSIGTTGSNLQRLR